MLRVLLSGCTGLVEVPGNVEPDLAPGARSRSSTTALVRRSLRRVVHTCPPTNKNVHFSMLIHRGNI